MELLVYKASAGSGKTFTLAVEYIKHLIANPRAYRQILAVTFTNKATTEMKERILQQLYGIWQADPASDAYLKRIEEDLARHHQTGMPKPCTTSELRQRAGMALQYILHDYSRFRVETIDSFFQSVMRNLARELELSPNLNIELNNNEVLSDAVDTLIDQLTPTSPVLAWLLAYIDERIADDKRWNVSDEIKRFGRNIFDEGYIERGEMLRQKLRDPQAVRLYRDVLREMLTDALEQMKAFYDQFVGELEAHALTSDDLKGGTRSIGSYFRKLRDGKLADKDVLNTTLKNCLDDPQNWASKTSTRKKDIIHLAESSLMPLLRDSERLRPQRNQTVNSCRLSLQHLDKLQLLNHIDEQVRILNKEQNRFLLSDTNALLHRLLGEGDSSFVFEKIGASIHNVMIDEFQDTSRMQWDNFRMLLLEGLAQGADSLIVGDVKQSIYRWRNGDWSILNNLGSSTNKDSFGSNRFPIRVETLKTNRRSETNIIQFNNHFFTQAVDYLNALHLDELHEECYPLKNAYADVAQESPRSLSRGYVKASFLEPDNDHNYTEQTLIALGNEVRHLLDSGILLNDITILVRKNKNIPLIADYFDQELHLPVVSDEAFRLDASVAVSMLIDALRILLDPDDKISQASLATNYAQYVATSPIQWHQLFAEPNSDILPEAFCAHTAELRLMPLYELLEELYSILHLNLVAKQDAYLFSFFDAVTQYLQDNPSDIGHFIRHWEDTLCAQTIPSGEVDGIRILSIHKSKGLEFHTVLIPFCDWKLENETNNQLVWCQAPSAPYNALDLVPVTYSPLMAESVYRSDYLDERLQLWVDNLNLLYVAFTRPEKNLIVWSKKDQRGTVAELLANALPSVAKAIEGSLWDEEFATFESGSLCPSTLSGQENKTSANKLAFSPHKQPVRMESLKHDIEFRQSNRSADFIAGIDEEESAQRFINRGRLLHTLFSAIETEADIDNAVSHLVAEGVIGHQTTADEIRELTRRAFSLPEVKQWYSGEWRLFNECDIIWLDNGKLLNRRPDRVMMKGDDIVVVDFKFGKPSKRYNRQVQDYMRLLVRMGYTASHISGYLWYVDMQQVEKIDFEKQEKTKNK